MSRSLKSRLAALEAAHKLGPGPDAVEAEPVDAEELEATLACYCDAVAPHYGAEPAQVREVLDRELAASAAACRPGEAPWLVWNRAAEATRRAFGGPTL